MLKELTIRNFAIIEDLSIEFKNGMSIFLGETGAGKSIIINALALLTGERAQTSYIRDGQNRAFVEATFSFDEIDEELKQYQIDDNTFVFTRVISQESSNICKINGFNVTISTLKNTLGKRINIHSQHDTYYLLDDHSHLSLLDKFDFQSIEKEKKVYLDSFHLLNSKQEEYNKLATKTIDEDIDYLKFQLNEITSVDLKDGEMESLELEASRIKKFQKINQSINSIIEKLNGESGVLELLYDAKKEILQVSDDPLFANDEESLNELYEKANDTYEKIKDNFYSLDIDVNKMSEIEERLYKINKLKRKFGNSYKEINQAKQIFLEKINFLENKEESLNKSLIEIENIKKDCYKQAQVLKSIRKKIALNLKKSIEKELKDLYLDKTIFEVEFKEIPLTSNGSDKIQFLLSTNVGEELKPLAKVASGGESSRLTLGLNVIFNKIYGINLSIFDEVDSGVSGKVATSVGLKIKEISKNYQVIVISHLPQVIAKGDNFYYVGKIIEDGRTKTYVKVLNEEQKIFEIAKMLSGSDIPSTLFIENAKELIK